MQTKQLSPIGHFSLLGTQTFFPLSAFLCPAFHLGSCTWKARLVNSFRARALVEEIKILTQVSSFSRKGSQLLGWQAVALGGMRLWLQRRTYWSTEYWTSPPDILRHLGQSPWTYISNKFLEMPIHLNMEYSDMDRNCPITTLAKEWSLHYFVAHAIHYSFFAKQEN